MGILVEDIVEISNFPVVIRFVLNRSYLEEVQPSEVGFEPNNVLSILFISASKQDS